MNVGAFGVMLSGAASVVLVTVVLFELRCWRIRSATGRFGRRLEEITNLVEDAQRRHGTRLRGLERRLELAERAVGRAEDMAYRSVSGVRTLRDDIGPRLLAAERSVGLHDVVVDLDAVAKAKAKAEAEARVNGDGPDDESGDGGTSTSTSTGVDGNGNGDGDRPEREPQPAGQPGSS
jgi:hypothetical protein